MGREKMSSKMKIKRYQLPFLLPDLVSVLGRLGYNKNKTLVEDSLNLSIREQLTDSRPYIKPIGISMDIGLVKVEKEFVEIPGGIVFESVKVAEMLKNSDKISILVCTIGGQISDEISRLIGIGEMTRGVVLDAIASEAVDGFADYITDVLKQEKVYSGLKPTMRYSPGYGDFKTDIHKDLLSLLQSDQIGVSCHNSSYVLKPEKSITAIIEWVR